MSKILIRLILKYNNFKSLNIVKRKQKALSSKVNAEAAGLPIHNNICSIIFSKDRAMQLNAFLSSYITLVANYKSIYILYKCSNIRHEKSYEDLKKMYINEPFIFIKEENFRTQLLNILKQENAKNTLFYVDDMIFTRPIDYGEIKDIDTNKYTLVLTRGEDLTYSVVLNKPLKVPTFKRYSPNFVSFDWFEYNEFSDWQYPLGVSGYMFGREECLVMLENIMFKGPNSLEGNMQLFISLSKQKKGLCPLLVSAVCVHANLVQTEGTNNILGVFSIEKLLELWEQSLQIDVRQFYNKDATIAQELSYKFIHRN